MKVKNQWVQEHLTNAKATLPFSFGFDGKASEALLAECQVFQGLTPGWTKCSSAKMN